MIEELRIKPSNTFQNFAAEHHATTGLPVDHPLAIPCPTCVGVRNEEIRDIRQRPQIQCRYPAPPNRRKRTCSFLVGTISIQYSAPECAGFGMVLGEGQPFF